MKLPVASHTFLNDWDNCPHKAARKYILKDLPREPETDAMRWGTTVHKAFEHRLNERKPFPEGMEKYEAIAKPLADAGARGELTLGMRADLSPCDFWDKQVWLRGKIDASYTPSHVSVIFDWKTGKKREDASELKTHAVLLRAHYPQVTIVVAHYVWLQTNEIGKQHVIREAGSHLADIQHTMADVERAIETEFFPKRQNPLCGWCPVKDCEFNRTGR